MRNEPFVKRTEAGSLQAFPEILQIYPFAGKVIVGGQEGTSVVKITTVLSAVI